MADLREISGRIGPYRVLKPLAAGGMGRVFLARDTRLGRVVALKFAQAMLEQDPAAREQFLLEARATASLSHPSVVTVFDVGEHEGVPWTAFEYVEGRTLAQRLKQGPIERGEALRIVRAVAEAVAAAHERGILHRDLKPSNIVLGHDGRPKVLDFGIARFVDEVTPVEGAVSPVEGKNFLGTPSYMAPEQWRRQDVEATDVWALGLILCVCLTRVHPLRNGPDVVISAVLTGPVIERVPALHALPPALSALVEQCLSLDPGDRPTAREVAERLAECERAPAQPLSDDEEPFCGPRPYDETRAEFFFGRERERDALEALVSDRPIVTLLGPAGCGKTSLVEAGLLPQLRARGARVVSVRPGRDPFASLASALASAGWSGTGPSRPDEVPTVRNGVAELESVAVAPSVDGETLAAQPDRLAVALDQLAERLGADRVLLWVDGLEDLLDPAVSEPVRARFLSAVFGASASVTERARVLIALRDEALGPLTSGASRPDALFSLAPLSAEGMTLAIGESLGRVGYRPDDEASVWGLARSAERSRSPMLALQCALIERWALRSPAGRVVPFEPVARGDADAAIARHADRVYERLSEADRALARPLLVAACVGSTELLRAGADDEAARRSVAEVLVRERVLERAASTGVLSLSTPSLRVLWPALGAWVEASDGDAVAIRELHEGAARWRAKGRPSELLLRGRPLSEAVSLRDRRTDALSQDGQDFVQTSFSADRRARRRRAMARGWLLASLILVALSSLLAAWALFARSADDRRARDRADRDRVALLVRSAALRYASGDPFSARSMVRAALEVRDDIDARALLETLRSEPLRWSAVPDSFAYAVTYGEDGRHAYAAMLSGELLSIDDASGDVTVIHRDPDQCLSVTPYRGGALWSTGSGEVLATTGPRGPVRRLRAFPSPVRMARVLSDGRVVVMLLDRRVVVFDPEGRRPDRWITVPFPSVNSIAVSAREPTLVLGGFEGQLSIVELDGGAPPTLISIGEPIATVAFGRDGRTVYVGRRSGMVSRVEQGRVTAEYAGNSTLVRAIVELDDRLLLVAGFRGGEVSLLDRATGERRVLLTGVDVNELSVSGTRVLAAGTRGVLGLWLDHTAIPRDAPRAPTITVGWSPDNASLYVGSEGLQTWSARDGNLLRAQSLGAERFPRWLSASPDGRLAFLLPGRGAVVVEARTGAMRSVVGDLSVLSSLDADWSRDLLALGADSGRVLIARLSDGSTVATVRERPSVLHDVRLVAGRDEVEVLSEGVISRWEFTSSSLLVRREMGEELRGMVADPSGRFLAIVGLNGFAALLDRNTLSTLASLPGARGRLHRGAWSPDGRTFAAPSSDGIVYLWTVDDGPAGPVIAPVRLLRAHPSEANGAAFDGTGRWIASVGDDGTVRVFDARTLAPRWRPVGPVPPPSGLSIRDGRVMDGQGRPVAARPGVGALLASPVEEQTAIGYENGSVELWAPGAAAPRRLEGGSTSPVRWLRSAPFGTVFAGFDDGRACVWHARTGVRIGCRSLNGPIAFGQTDGRAITAVSALGDRARISLDSLERPWCDLLREIWREQPSVWSGDAQVRAPPPREHPCR